MQFNWNHQCISLEMKMVELSEDKASNEILQMEL